MEPQRLLLAERVKNEIQFGESQFREFKSALEGQPRQKRPRSARAICADIGEALVAFANSDGGVLLIGVEDSGEVTGVPHDAEDIQSMLAAPRTHVRSSASLPLAEASVLRIDNESVIFFAVNKGTSEIYQLPDGRCVGRKDRETVPISPAQLHFDRQETKSREYDRQFVDGASVRDLDTDLLQSVANDCLPGLSFERYLQQMGLAEYEGTSLRLRMAALLLFSRTTSKWHPGSYVRILKILGTSLGAGSDYNVLSDEYIPGNIFFLILNSWETLRPFLAYKTEFGSEAKFEQRFMYPEAACREALVNALAHRDYLSSNGVVVYIYDDRIEIKSPGSLLSTITVNDLYDRRGVHESRNTLISKVLKEAKIMRELGEGIRRIFELMEQFDLHDPKLEASRTDFAISMSNRSVFTERQERYMSLFDEYDASRLQKRILVLGIEGNEIAPDDIYRAMNTNDRDTYDREVTALRKAGLLVQIRTNAQANLFAKQHNADKGKVPRFKVAAPSTDRPSENGIVRDSDAAARELFQRHPECCVYVENVPPYASNDRIRGFFEVCGSVESVVFPAHKLNVRLERFCFVRFADRGAADRALKRLNGKTLDQHVIAVKRYYPPTKPLHRGRSASKAEKAGGG